MIKKISLKMLSARKFFLSLIILLWFFNDLVFGILFAAVAGIMVFISLDELLPTAREYGQPHHAIYGLIAGMAVMAGSLLIFCYCGL